MLYEDEINKHIKFNSLHDTLVQSRYMHVCCVSSSYNCSIFHVYAGEQLNSEHGHL
jgi:hypothetical protein